MSPGFYNHYHDLFSEDLTGQAFLETNSGSSASVCFRRSSAMDFWATTKGVEIAPEWRPTELLAAARIVFVSAHECGQSAGFRRCRHCAGIVGVQSAASGDGSVRVRPLEEASVGSHLSLRECAAGPARSLPIPRAMPASAGDSAGNSNCRLPDGICSNLRMWNTAAIRVRWSASREAFTQDDMEPK